MALQITYHDATKSSRATAKITSFLNFLRPISGQAELGKLTTLQHSIIFSRIIQLISIIQNAVQAPYKALDICRY